jgi:hypothetical protein
MSDLILSTSTAIHQYGPIVTGIIQDNEEQIHDASRITWEDSFFDGEENVVAVFDFDYPLMEAYQVKLLWAKYIWVHSLLTLYVLYIVFLIFLPFSMEGTNSCQFLPMSISIVVCVVLVLLNGCFARKRAQWDVYSQHLCITRDGVDFVRDKRKTGFGWSCTDAGKTTQTVPFDKITNVDIEEPAGGCCIRKTLTSVKLTSSSSGTNSPPLVIHGLKEPYKFKSLLLEAKRSNATAFMASATPAQMVSDQVIIPIAYNKEMV